MFSLIDVVDGGHKKLLVLIKEYDLIFDSNEINMIKESLSVRSDHYVPSVNQGEQQQFAELMARQSYTYSSANVKRPKRITISFGKKQNYKFEIDDVIMEAFVHAIDQLAMDFNSGKINRHKEHDLYKVVAPLYEFAKSIAKEKGIEISPNRLKHFIYDLMAIVSPEEFNPTPPQDLKEDQNRYKASTINRIISIK